MAGFDVASLEMVLKSTEIQIIMTEEPRRWWRITTAGELVHVCCRRFWVGRNSCRTFCACESPEGQREPPRCAASDQSFPPLADYVQFSTFFPH